MIIDGKEVIEISQKDFAKLLEDEENLLIYGKKGIGKSSIVREFAKKVNKKLIMFSLATMLPEFIGGVPYAKTDAEKKTEYFTLLLNETLAPMLECKGENYILFFDEINQAPTEVMNCLYSICHIDPKQREWCGHSLEFAQIVAAGNLNNGEDGNVYLNDLPDPLHDRFFTYQLVTEDKDTLEYLKDKYKNIPRVEEIITTMLDEKINPRNIDKVLDLLQCKKSPLLLRAKLGTALTKKILDIQKGAENTDPSKMLKGIKASYKQFLKDGVIAWGEEVITEENKLIEKFKTLISEEELASVLAIKDKTKKGGK